jgi:hypothetical protein
MLGIDRYGTIILRWIFKEWEKEGVEFFDVAQGREKELALVSR